MANTNNTEQAVVEALGAWLMTAGNAAPYSLGLLQVATQWSEQTLRRAYPEAEIEQVSWDAEEYAPFPVEGATGLLPGKICLCYGRFSSKLRLDFWIASKGQRAIIESAMHRALHSDPARGGLWIKTDSYFGEPVSFTLVSKERLDTEDDVRRGVYRLVFTIEAETALLSADLTAPYVILDARFIVDDDPDSATLAAAALTLNPAAPTETIPVPGEAVPAPFSNLP
jgi:hypothetical protein